MPIIPDEPPAGRPLTRADFLMRWWPEFTAAATCVSAGLLLWGPLAGLAAVPLLSPAAEAVQLAGLARREAEQERLALAEPVGRRADPGRCRAPGPARDRASPAMSCRRSAQRGARRAEPVDPHAPIEGQLALFGDDPQHVAEPVGAASAPSDPAEVTR